MSARLLHLNCHSGISGDMLVASLLHLGAGREAMQEAVGALGLGPVSLEVSPVSKGGIAALSLDVVIPAGTPDLPTPARVREVVEGSGLPPAWKERVLAVFDRLARAEAAAHGCAPEEVHFHELGSADTVVDVVCAVAGLELLGVGGILASPVNVGGGAVRTAHGTFPVPAPATARLLEGFDIFSDGEEGEKATPTGAALLAAFARPAREMPPLTVAATGYGAGKADFSRSVNVLQALLGEASDIEAETSVVLECTIDDMNPQVYPYLVERLLAAGAQDAYLAPVIMKKGRPGVAVTVIASPAAARALGELLLAESTTIGLRHRTVGRWKAHRELVTMETPHGPVRVKVIRAGGRRRAAAEFEDCRALAERTGRPLPEIMAEMNRLAAEMLEGDDG